MNFIDEDSVANATHLSLLTTLLSPPLTPELKTQNSKLKTQNLKLKTQNSKLKT